MKRWRQLQIVRSLAFGLALLVGTQLTFFALHVHQHQLRTVDVLSATSDGNSVLHEASDACAICVVHASSQLESTARPISGEFVDSGNFLSVAVDFFNARALSSAFRARAPPLV